MSGQELTPWERARAEILADRPLLPGEQLVYHRNPHELRAWLARAVRRGDVARTGRMGSSRTGAWVVIIPLKEPRPRWPWWMGLTTVVLGYIAAWGFLLAAHWRAMVGVSVAGWVGYWLLTRVSHKGACPGLHCRGCRG